MMNNNISDAVLLQLSERIRQQMGLVFTDKNWISFKRGLGSAAEDFGFTDTDACGHWLLASPLTRDRINTLACHLTIGETYFFREPNAFHALQEQVLPAMLLSRQGADRRLRIWCIGCSTGEEPYSLAILLTRMLPDLQDWKISILATDVNPRSLQKAQAGVYSEWSFRAPPEWLKSDYFVRRDDRYEIHARIKRMVSFEPLNLAEDVYPSLANGTNAMDILMCRNVMMYFSSQLQDRIIQRFHHALVDGGWLIVSPSEASSARFPQFTTINFPGANFFLKSQERRDIQEQWLVRTPFETAAPLLQVSDLPQSVDLPPIPQTVAPLLGFSPASPVNPPSLRPQPQPDPYPEAYALYQQGQYRQVAALLAQHPNALKKGRLSDLLARAYANQGQFAEALTWCDRALSLEMLNPGYHYLRAIILQEQEQFAEAIKTLRQVLCIEPDFVLAHFALGNLYRQRGNLPEAQRHFQTVRNLLHTYAPNDVLPESDGMTAIRLNEIVKGLFAPLLGESQRAG